MAPALSGAGLDLKEATFFSLLGNRRSSDASIRCIASPLVFAVWTEFLSHDPDMGGPLKFNAVID
jgi:hypothetical protein